MIMNSHLSELFFKNAQIIEIDFPLKAYTKVIFNLGDDTKIYFIEICKIYKIIIILIRIFHICRT